MIKIQEVRQKLQISDVYLKYVFLVRFGATG